MKFKHGTRRRALEYEKDWRERWKKDKTFEKSVTNRPADNSYVFYDGPPFITGVPHYGTLLSSIIKDAIPRYQTMKGKRVERVWGWDCHGLPAENFVEKQLVITDRRQIVTDTSTPAPLDKDGKELKIIPLEDYIRAARQSMVDNSQTWEPVIDRIGRWVDFKGAYKTMDKDYMESVWWAFKKLYEAGKIYEGEKVLMYDTKFATPVSKAEVTMDNDAYQTVTDPSVYAKFPLLDEAGKETGSALLAWTTTPWTLPANLMLAISSKLEYVEVELEASFNEKTKQPERLVLAKDALEAVMKDEKNKPIPYKIIREVPVKELINKKYKPINVGSTWPKNENIHTVYEAGFVTSNSGTGIVHVAPAYGEDDFNLAQELNIEPFHVIDDHGYYTDTVYKGKEVWSSNKQIAKDLKEKGIAWKIEYIRHEYPFNPRSKQRIMYRAIPSWFFDIENSKTTMLTQNQNINWFPTHLKNGRFAKNIDQAPDWNISRDRFWATAMPVWKGDKGSVKVVGSYQELKELSGQQLDDYHRPWVDSITFEIEGEKFTRVDKVLDGWFESASMPFAQLHYPFKNKKKFEQNYPADFIVEYVGQIRAWFYYVHALNVALAEAGAFGETAKKNSQKNAFKNVITTGVISGSDGRKMSKSLGNFTDPNVLMDKFSADSLRFLLLSSPLLSGEDFTLQDKDVGDVARKLTMLWNMYDFFTMYAEVDGWQWDGATADPSNNLENPLDTWIVSRLHQTIKQVEEGMDVYDLPTALKPILPFIDDASNWYVRRSRRRFWKSGDDKDKDDAYRTLHYILLQSAFMLAPFTPFLAEELHHKLTGSEQSIHLMDWPESGKVDVEVVNEMNELRSQVTEALSLRAKAAVKIRQPLASVSVPALAKRIDSESILKEELNVKEVLVGPGVQLDLNITPALKQEGLSREVIRVVQNARKKAGLNVDERINLSLRGGGLLQDVIKQYQVIISNETLASTLNQSVMDDGLYNEVVKIDGEELEINLKRA